MDEFPTFPQALAEPTSYLKGVDASTRPRSNNVLVFLRQDRESLQQMHFRNRSHHRHVLILSLHTTGTVIVDGIELTLRPESGLMILPYQFHHYMNLESDDLRWLFITFELEENSSALDGLSHRIIHPDKDALEIWSQIASFWTAQSTKPKEECVPLLDLLLLKLERGSTQKPTSHTVSSWIAQTETLIRKAVDEQWTLKEVAQRSGISERHLRTRFEAETGITIRRYRANYQLHRTLSLMRGAHVALGEIAGRGGFQSSASFSRFIRRETGMTAMELKRSLGPPS